MAINYGSAGLMSGAPDPAMRFPQGVTFTPYAALRNTTDGPLPVSISLAWMKSDGTPMTDALPIVTLAPGESRQVDMAAALARAGLTGFNGMLNVGVSFSGYPGDLVLATGSVDSTGTFVFEVEPQGVGPTNSKQVASWTARPDGTDTMYSLWNPTASAQDIVLTLLAGEGSGTYKLPLHLAPHGSATVDVGALIKAQRPDADGHVIAPTVTEGSAIVDSAAGRRTAVTLVVSGGTFNVRTGTCGPTCINCCGYTFGVTPGDFLVPVGESMACEFQGTDCNGGVIDFGANWSTSDSSVMTVDSSGTVTGTGAGTATITGQLTQPTDVFTGQICSTGSPTCPTGEPQSNTSGIAQVPTYVAIVGTPAYTQGPPAPYAYNVNRQILDQQNPPQPINAVMHVHESYSPNPPSGNCTSNAVDVGDADSNSAGIFGPDIYSLPGSAPNPCTSSSTQSFAVTLAGHAYNIQTTYAVTWQFAGVTVVAR